ncbi:hypothetical protein D3C81_1945260 [compost metagenome]
MAELTEILLQHESLAGTGVSFLLGAEFQIRRLRRSIDFPRIGAGLIASQAGLQLRLITRFSCRATLAGDQCLRADLRGLHAVIGIGGTGRRVNGFDDRGENLHATVECL